MTATSYTIKTYDPDANHGIDLSVAKVTTSTLTGAGNGLIVTNAFNTRHDSLAVYVENTAEAAKKLTIKAGDYPNAILGDLVISVAAGKEMLFKIDDASRFQKKAGKLGIEFESGFTGYCAVIAEATNFG